MPHPPRFSSRISLLQRLDRYVGVPVCFALTLARRLTIKLPSARSHPISHRVLFVKLTEQGSTVLASNAIRRAVAQLGAENVYFLVFEENREILDLMALVPSDNVFAIGTRSTPTLLASAIKQLRAIRRLGIDTCIDLEFFARSTAAIGYLSGASRRIGFHAGRAPYRGDLLTDRIPYDDRQHVSDAFASSVEPLVAPERGAAQGAATEIPWPDYSPPFVATAAEQDQIRDLLRSAGISGDRRLIIINANAGDLLPQRKWPEQNYVTLARELLDTLPDVTVVWTGSTNEAAEVDTLAAVVGSHHSVSLAGETTLRQLLVLFTLGEVLVTNDSGPAHFASLTSIDVVTLFGPETPRLFAARGRRSHPLWVGLPCSPCVSAFNNRQTSCRDNRCMKAHAVETVSALVSRIYRRRSIEVMIESREACVV